MALTIDPGQCENSGVCAAVCPEEVLEIVEQVPVIVKPGACTSCWICVENCVSGAIQLD